MTIPKQLYPLLIVAVLSVLFPACTSDKELDADRLERSLMHVWIANTQGDWSAAEAGGKEALLLWKDLQRGFPQSLLSPSEKQSLAKINLWMSNLRFAIDYKQKNNVDIALALMRNELTAVRPQYVEQHAADELYKFHASWSEVVATAHDPMLCLLEWNEFEELVEQAREQWQTYEQTRPQFEDALFPGYAGHDALVEDRKVALEQALTSFEANLQKANHSLLAAPGDDIMILYFEYLAAITGYSAGPVDKTL